MSSFLLSACGKFSAYHETKSDTLANRHSTSVDSELTNEEKHKTELNKALNLVAEKKYDDAIDTFKSAIEQNENDLELRYNYVKTLTLLKKIDYPGYFDTEFVICKHLDEIVKRKPEYIKMIKEDTDFDVLKKDFRFLKLLGYSVDKSEDSKFILANLNWYVRSLGSSIDIYGQLEFSDDNTFVFWLFTPESITSFGKIKDKYVYTGKYTVEKTKIILVFNEKMLLKRTVNDILENTSEFDEDLTTIEGEIQEDGSIKFDVFDYTLHWLYPSNG